MDDNVHKENVRHKTDHYKSVHAQWMMPQHQMKDSPALKLMTLLTERDNAIQELNIAISEKRAALAERDMAIVHRDGAIAERNAAIMERDNALAALDYARQNSLNGHGVPASPPQHLTEPYPMPTTASDDAIKGRKAKRSRKEKKDQAKKASKTPKKGRIGGGEDLNKQISDFKYQEWKVWKVQDLGLNQVPFDESIMQRPPGCSCTGKLQHCYKWGSGGWQSACCTKTLSMYPLPVMPNKRHARVAGRKMSGSAFVKLLTRLAAEGYDLSAPLDLKDHWAKHGTNRYITIK
ncbi:barley B recombinant-like protein D [Dendrobium catenatum]|nr:barley B recombinant-like protein D [Dendrobium catenatum]XP_020685662.1 barley B recombinant-like protein D [Dendrobium catenatum]